MIDNFTRDAEAAFMASQDAETITNMLVDQYVSQHGAQQLPEGGGKSLGINKTRTTPGHPQGTD